MLFGSGKRLSKFKEYLQFNIKYNETLVNCTTSFEYLVVLLNETLNLSEHGLYKKASERPSVLLRIRQSMTTRAAATVYEMTIVPVVTYCFLVNTWSCPSRENKLDRLVKKAQDIVLETEDPSKVNITLIKNPHMKKLCCLTFKCLNLAKMYKITSMLLITVMEHAITNILL